MVEGAIGVVEEGQFGDDSDESLFVDDYIAGTDDAQLFLGINLLPLEGCFGERVDEFPEFLFAEEGVFVSADQYLFFEGVEEGGVIDFVDERSE